MRYYFNIRVGKNLLDEEGTELDTMEAVRNGAVQSSADSKGLHGEGTFLVGRSLATLGDRPTQGGDKTSS